MEEMGSRIKEQYICPLSGIARYQGPLTGKNNYRPGTGVCLESDRFNPRFHTSHRLPGRSCAITVRDLVGHSFYSSRSVAGMPGSSSGANDRITGQSSGFCRNYPHLDSCYSWFRAVDLVVSQPLKNTPVMQNVSYQG